MTVGTPGAVSAANDEPSERVLATRIIDTLLREDYGGLSGRVRCRDGGAVLDLPGGSGGDRALPLERDGFLADFRLRRTEAGLPATALTLDEVDAAIAADPGARLGWRGLPGYEALAASVPHPAYPTSESRAGFSDEDSLRYAPEYCPQFPLHWVAVPRSRLTVAGRLAPRPAGWPTMPEVGLAVGLAAPHDLLPVHPVTPATASSSPSPGRLVRAGRRASRGRGRPRHRAAGDSYAVHQVPDEEGHAVARNAAVNWRRPPRKAGRPARLATAAPPPNANNPARTSATCSDG